MKERLDFIGQMLPLVNFVRDYFQKVECEASVQLMRLKNAQVMQGVVDEDGVGDVSLETVKWLHYMTDAVMSVHNGGSELKELKVEPTTPGMSPGLAAAFPSLGPVTEGDATIAGRLGAQVRLTADVDLRERRANNQSGQPGAGDRNSPGIFAAAAPRTGYEALDAKADTASQQGTSPLTRERGPGVVLPTLGERDAAGGTSILSAIFPAGTSPSPPSVNTPQPRSTGGAVLSARPQSDMEEPLAEPGTGGTNERAALDGIAMTGSGGLIMGRGSWATAYRQASGNRREALRLLCTSGIVTARELSDDLTVISEEHIEECVQIAAEMLQTWTLEMWARQPQEAKKFFEARLTALYQRKFGEQAAQKGTSN
jgi:hypothetical protein